MQRATGRPQLKVVGFIRLAIQPLRGQCRELSKLWTFDNMNGYEVKDKNQLLNSPA